MRRMFVRIIFGLIMALTLMYLRNCGNISNSEREGGGRAGRTFSTSEYLGYLSGFINSTLDSYDIEKQEGPALTLSKGH